MKSKIDVLNHNLVPKHFKLSEKEKKQILEQYNITINELPKIAASDPALKDLSVKTGDVVKIVRISKTSGKTVYHRGVINA